LIRPVPSIRLDNRFLADLPGDPEQGPRLRQVHGAAWSAVMPTPVRAPRLLAASTAMLAELGWTAADAAHPDFVQVFAGNALFQGMQPWAANYGGHQFGHWAGQLGDGRAISLGEAIGTDGRRWELQLKGAGPTPYSRHADGRAVLRSSIREFLCSEAMHHLGVPSTRALCLVATGEEVVRDMFYDGHPRAEPGAIVCRAAPSFLRFGSYELPTSRGDAGLLAKLVDFTIELHFPEFAGAQGLRRADWFAEVAARTARLMVEWMRVGFVHGVMNTDNFSIHGLTLDYGPYGWIDNVDPDWTPNTTDAQGRRYRFGTQPQVGYWNLQRLAGALAPVMATEDLHRGLRRYVEVFTEAQRAMVGAKLGLAAPSEADEACHARLMELLQRAEIDMSLFFRALCEWSGDASDLGPFRPAFYREPLAPADADALRGWLRDYAARLAEQGRDEQERRAAMRRANPRYVLRNYLAQQAIDRAEQGDGGGILDLLEVMARPYEDQPGREAFAARRPDWARDRAGCSMLSCSS
jgi:serine/tyrosine/threonine adenylyltransferase